jgi:hypothetical protein
MFDARRFLADKFKTPGGVVAFVTAYGRTPPSLHAVEKWWQRNSLPADWLAILLSLLEIETGAPTSIVGYILKEGATNGDGIQG